MGSVDSYGDLIVSRLDADDTGHVVSIIPFLPKLIFCHRSFYGPRYVYAYFTSISLIFLSFVNLNLLFLIRETGQYEFIIKQISNISFQSL